MYQFHKIQDGFIELLDFHLFRCAFQAQVVLRDTEFMRVEHSLFRATARGISLEILVYAPGQSLLITNAMLRLASTGARVFWCKEHDQKSVLIVDKNLLFLKDSPSPDNHDLPLESVGLFKQLCTDATQIYSEHGQMHVDFYASADVVDRGAPVELHWNVVGANTVFLEPSLGFVSPQGSATVQIEEDTLFQLDASNADCQRTAVVFVKCGGVVPLRLELSRYESLLDEFIPLYSPAGFDNDVAVIRNSQVRIRWHAAIPGVLREVSWGSLPLSGERLTTITEDTTLIFEYRGSAGITTVPVRFFTPNPAGETTRDASQNTYTLRDFRKIFRKKNDGKDD